MEINQNEQMILEKKDVKNKLCHATLYKMKRINFCVKRNR